MKIMNPNICVTFTTPQNPEQIRNKLPEQKIEISDSNQREANIKQRPQQRQQKITQKIRT